MKNKVHLSTESRIHREVYVRFGGEHLETCHSNMIRRWVLTLLFSLIRAIGLILLGFGILQIGLALKSHDASQRANGILTVAGGIVITFTKEILTLITGG